MSAAATVPVTEEMRASLLERVRAMHRLFALAVADLPAQHGIRHIGELEHARALVGLSGVA